MRIYEIYINGVWVGDVVGGSIEDAIAYGEDYYGKEGDLIHAVEREEGGESGEE